MQRFEFLSASTFRSSIGDYSSHMRGFRLMKSVTIARPAGCDSVWSGDETLDDFMDPLWPVISASMRWKASRKPARLA
jgi:hypothetical protein